MKKLLFAASLALTGFSANAQLVPRDNTIHYGGYVSNVSVGGHNSIYSLVPYLFTSPAGGTIPISTNMTSITVSNGCFNEDFSLSAVDAAAPAPYYRYVPGCGSPLIEFTKNADHEYTILVMYPLGG